MDSESKAVFKSMLELIAGIFAEQRCFMNAVVTRLEEREITSALAAEAELSRMREVYHEEWTRQILAEFYRLPSLAALREEESEDVPSS